MSPSGFPFFVLVQVFLWVGETSSSHFSSVNIPSSMVMWQNGPVETIVASHLQVAITMKSSKGDQNLQANLHRNTDSRRETLTSKGYNFPLTLRKNKFVTLENGNKATFECKVEPPFIGYSKPWIELHTGNFYCLFFPYSQDMKLHHDHSLEEARHVSAPSLAIFLGRLSLSGTRKMMNVSSELNDIILSILENSDVRIYSRKKDYLSMSFWKDFSIEQSEVKKLSFEEQIIITLSATSQRLRMTIYYEKDDQVQEPVNKDLVFFNIFCFFCILVIIMLALVLPKPPPRKQLRAYKIYVEDS